MSLTKVEEALNTELYLPTHGCLNSYKRYVVIHTVGSSQIDVVVSSSNAEQLFYQFAPNAFHRLIVVGLPTMIMN